MTILHLNNGTGGGLIMSAANQRQQCQKYFGREGDRKKMRDKLVGMTLKGREQMTVFLYLEVLYHYIFKEWFC